MALIAARFTWWKLGKIQDYQVNMATCSKYGVRQRNLNTSIVSKRLETKIVLDIWYVYWKCHSGYQPYLIFILLIPCAMNTFETNLLHSSKTFKKVDSVYINTYCIKTSFFGTF